LRADRAVLLLGDVLELVLARALAALPDVRLARTAVHDARAALEVIAQPPPSSGTVQTLRWSAITDHGQRSTGVRFDSHEFELQRAVDRRGRRAVPWTRARPTVISSVWRQGPRAVFI